MIKKITEYIFLYSITIGLVISWEEVFDYYDNKTTDFDDFDGGIQLKSSFHQRATV